MERNGLRVRSNDDTWLGRHGHSVLGHGHSDWIEHGWRQSSSQRKSVMSKGQSVVVHGRHRNSLGHSNDMAEG